MDVKIEKGVPIPISYKGKTLEWIAVFRKMEIGDSFACDEKDSRIAVRAALGGNMKATARRDEGGLYRVWRIKPDAKKS